MSRLRYMVWMGIFGCVHRGSVEPEGVGASEAPILPAFEAAVYVRSLSIPGDPLVAQVVKRSGLSWEESLSGAAAGIALERQVPSLDGAAWAGVVAGYPYPVVNLVQGQTDPGAWPEGLVEAITGVLLAGDDLGLVRARVGDRDHWVALIGRPALEIGPLHKELALGDSLILEAVEKDSLHYTLVSPTGRLQVGKLPAQPTVSESGEWWLEIRSKDGEPKLGIPVYVDLKTPSQPLLDLPGSSVSSSTSARQEASFLLNDIRAQFDLSELIVDGTLDTLAIQPLAHLQSGNWILDDELERLRAAGFLDASTAQIRCESSTVARCLAEMMEDPHQRRKLLQPDAGLFGLATAVKSDGVSIVINLAAP